MAMLLHQKCQPFQFDKWQHTQYDRCKSYQIVCTWLHTGHPKQPFAFKGCTNPARHISPGLAPKFGFVYRIQSEPFVLKRCTNLAR